MGILCLFIQEQRSKLNLFLHSKEECSQQQALLISQQFSKLIATNTAVRGDVVILKRFRAVYVLLNEIYLVTVCYSDDYPFDALRLTNLARSLLFDACKNVDVTVAELFKSYGQIVIALEELLNETNTFKTPVAPFEIIQKKDKFLGQQKSGSLFKRGRSGTIKQLKQSIEAQQVSATTVTWEESKKQVDAHLKRVEKLQEFAWKDFAGYYKEAPMLPFGDAFLPPKSAQAIKKSLSNLQLAALDPIIANSYDDSPASNSGNFLSAPHSSNLNRTLPPPPSAVQIRKDMIDDSINDILATPLNKGVSIGIPQPQPPSSLLNNFSLLQLDGYDTDNSEGSAAEMHSSIAAVPAQQSSPVLGAESAADRPQPPPIASLNNDNDLLFIMSPPAAAAAVPVPPPPPQLPLSVAPVPLPPPPPQPVQQTTIPVPPPAVLPTPVVIQQVPARQTPLVAAASVAANSSGQQQFFDPSQILQKFKERARVLPFTIVVTETVQATYKNHEQQNYQLIGQIALKKANNENLSEQAYAFTLQLKQTDKLHSFVCNPKFCTEIGDFKFKCNVPSAAFTPAQQQQPANVPIQSELVVLLKYKLQPNLMPVPFSLSCKSQTVAESKMVRLAVTCATQLVPVTQLSLLVEPINRAAVAQLDQAQQCSIVAVQTKPEARWNATQQRLLWKIEHKKEDGPEILNREYKFLAQLKTDNDPSAAARLGPVSVKFACEGALFGEFDIEGCKQKKESTNDVFLGGMEKQIVSGKYEYYFD